MTMNSDTSLDAQAVSVLGSVGLGGDDFAVALLEQSNDCVKILSMDGRLEFMNCNGMAAMEIDAPELVIGKLWWDLWPASSREFVKQNFLEAVQGRETGFEAECPTAKGSHRRWIVSLRPLSAPDGQVVSVLSTSRDVTGAN